MLLKRLRETGTCTTELGQAVLLAELYCGASGGWEVNLRELDGSRTIQHRYETEQDARRALEAAYAYGRRHGTWRVDRAADYLPRLTDGVKGPQ